MTGVMVLQGREVIGADLQSDPRSAGRATRVGPDPPERGTLPARTWLLTLERAGHIRLPPRRGPSSNGSRNRHGPIVAPATDPIRCARRDLRPLTVTVVAPRSEDLRLFNGLLAGDHDLGHRHTVGEHLRFIPDVRRALCA